MTDIAVVDYGMGNLRSVAKAIEQVAPRRAVRVTDDPHVVRTAQRVVVDRPDGQEANFAIEEVAWIARIVWASQ